MKHTVRRGAIGVATALAALAFASAAQGATTFYPHPDPSGNPEGGSEFNTGTTGWFDQGHTCTFIILDDTLCQTTNVWDGANGIAPSLTDNTLKPGSLRTNFTALALALGTVRGTGTWESPQFVISNTDPETVHFRIDRKAEISALLNVGGSATTLVRMYDATAGTATTIYQETLNENSNTWAKQVVQVPASLVQPGHRLAFRVITYVTGTLQALAGTTTVNYDNIVMRVIDAPVGV